MRTGAINAASCTMLLLAAFSAGCARGIIAAGDAKLPDDDGSPGFLDRIASQQSVCENDAMRGILMLLDGKDAAADFKDRVQRLRARNIIGADWDFDANRPVTRGRLAIMIHKAAGTPGGIILTLAGPSERYCLREMQYRGFIGPGAFYSPVTGSEYVAVISRADAYRRTGQLPQVMTASSN